MRFLAEQFRELITLLEKCIVEDDNGIAFDYASIGRKLKGIEQDKLGKYGPYHGGIGKKIEPNKAHYDILVNAIAAAMDNINDYSTTLMDFANEALKVLVQRNILTLPDDEDDSAAIIDDVADAISDSQEKDWDFKTAARAILATLKVNMLINI